MPVDPAVHLTLSALRWALSHRLCTQVSLAAYLGENQGTVSHWVRETRPLPNRPLLTELLLHLGDDAPALCAWLANRARDARRVLPFRKAAYIVQLDAAQLQPLLIKGGWESFDDALLAEVQLSARRLTESLADLERAEPPAPLRKAA